jgi:hypothetical protein
MSFKFDWHCERFPAIMFNVKLERCTRQGCSLRRLG